MSEEVNLQNFPSQLAEALNISTFGGEVLATLIMVIVVVVPILYLTKGKNVMLALIMTIMVLCFGIAVFNLPSWILVLLAILGAGLLSGTLRDWITGHYGG